MRENLSSHIDSRRGEMAQADGIDRRSQVHDASKKILGLVEAYKCLAAKDLRQLRNDIIELLLDDQGLPRYDYFVISRALHLLHSRRRVKMGTDEESGQYKISLR